jgi:energy-coupling factor transporter ATP-binding protein EcfA2
MDFLVLDQASFAYPSAPERPVLRDLDARIPLSGATLVLGGNGSGKTAMARLLAGLDSPSEGSLRWPNRDGGSEDTLRTAVVFEQPEFQFQGFSVAEELESGLLYRGVRRADAEHLAREGAEGLGLAELLDREVSSLEYPEMLAVLVASFLLLEPRLLVLDFSLNELEDSHRAMLLSRSGGEGQPALVVLSRRAVDLALLESPSCFILSEGGIQPFPATASDSGTAELLRSSGLAFPWYVDGVSQPAGGRDWSWLAPPAK